MAATDKAITRWPWWWAIAVLFTVQFLSGAIVSPHRSLFPVYAQERLAYSAFAISLLASVRQLLGMVASPLGGALCDHLGLRRTFLLGMTELAVSTLAFLTGWPPLVVLLWGYGGFAAGIHTVGSTGYLIAAARPAMLGLVSGLYNVGMTLGGALGNALGGPLAERGGFGLYGGVLLAASLATTLLAVVALPKVGQPATRTRTGWFASWRDYRDLIRRPPVVLLGLLRLLPTFYWGLSTVFIPLWIFDLTGSAATVAWYGSVSLVAASAMQWVIGWLSDRVGRRWPTILAAAAVALSSAALGLVGTRLESVFILGSLGAGAAWSLSVLLPGLVCDAANAEERGRVVGWLHLIWNGAMLIGSLIGGALFARAPGLPFLVTGALNVPTIVAAIWFFRLRRGMEGKVTTDARR